MYLALADTDTAQVREALLKSAPHVGAQVSTLGGRERASVLIALSLDPKEKWSYGIFENSRHMRFSIHYDGVLEQFQVHGVPKKFRKARVKSLDEALAKIQKYLKQLEELEGVPV